MATCAVGGQAIGTAAALLSHAGKTACAEADLPALRRRLADGRIPILGGQAVVEMAARGQPAMFVSGHLGNWELAPLVAHHLGMPPYSIYRAGNNPWLERLIRAQRDAASNQGRPRQDWQGFGIAKGAEGGKKLLQKMKQRQSIALLIDQRMNDGVAVPFFGQPAMTADAATKLALKYGYPIVMARVVRGRGHHLSVEILPAVWPQGFLDDAGGEAGGVGAMVAVVGDGGFV
jgi:KDO2-lipid IV(A) lauroyltransferase